MFSDPALFSFAISNYSAHVRFLLFLWLIVSIQCFDVFAYVSELISSVFDLVR